MVAAGQVLATLDPRNSQNEVERAKVNVELAQARLQEAKAGQTEEKVRHGAAAARILVAEAELKRTELELVQAQAQLEKTHLFAPIAGIVVKRQVEVGDVVNPAQGQPAATRLF